MRLILNLFLVIVFLSACSQAETTPSTKPALELTGRVVDSAELLDPETEKRIEAKLTEAEIRYGFQFVVVTTPSLEGRKIEDYTLELAESWGIGDKERNDGLVLLVAPDERQVRTEVGLGLESIFTDKLSGQIMQETILPLFRGGEMIEGIEQGLIG